MTFVKDFSNEQKFSRYFNDFLQYAATDWVITTTEAGGSSASETISAAKGGILVIANDTNDNDNDFLQHSKDGGTTPAECWKYVSGKKLYFGARIAVNDATDSDFVIGLQITDTSPLAVTDGIYFRKDDDDANLDFVVIKDSTASTLTAVHTVVDATYMTVEFYYDGSVNNEGTKIQAFVDGVGVGSVALTNVPDDEELAISFGIQNGAAASKTLSIDWIEVANER